MSANTSNINARGPAPRERATRRSRCLPWRARKVASWVINDFTGFFLLLNLFARAVVMGPIWITARFLPGPAWPPVLLRIARRGRAGGLRARDCALQEAPARGGTRPASAWEEQDDFLNRGFSPLLTPGKV